MGGSLGSKKLNETIRENLEVLLHDYQIIHLTGKGLVDNTIDKKVMFNMSLLKMI